MRFTKLTLLLCLLLLGLTAIAYAETTTVMMYMCGTDIQEDCLTDISEMTAAATGQDVRIVVLAGGTKNWTDSRLFDKKLNLFTIQNGRWSAVTDWGSGNMGDIKTLKRFVSYCWNNCKSDRNLLVLWDHGSSALDGMCFDEVYNDDSLTLSELGTAFSQLKSELNGFHLDIIGADACLMGSYEMAVTLAPYADYYVGSEELEPWLGWYYTNWLKALKTNPSISSRELAVSIVDSYIYGCNRDDPNDYLTLSAIDLGCMAELSTHINSLAKTLAAQINAGQFNTISRTVRSMYVFGNYDDSDSDMVDINEFLKMCESYDAETVAKARAVLARAIVKNYANSYVPTATGMSIFIPMQNRSSVTKYMSDYASGAVSGYTAFVSAFANSSSGNSWNFSGSNTVPYQLERENYTDNFLNTMTSWFNTNTYGSGFGYNTSSFVIAGTAGQTPTAKPTPATGGFVIAGQAVSPTPTAAPSQTTGGFVIAGQLTTPRPTIAPIDLSDAYSFSMHLSDEDMHFLAYAELTLYQDFSDEDGWDLDELGRVRDTWIDWNNNTVYAIFDGTWPSIGDVIVVMYEQSRTEYGRRCIIPIMLNDTLKTYLVVEYSNGSDTGRIIGTSEGWSENGLPVRGVTPLKTGDKFSPVYPAYMSDDTSVPRRIDYMSEAWAVYDDPDFITIWDGTQTVEQCKLPSHSEYLLAFRLYDIFGGCTTTDFISFAID